MVRVDPVFQLLEPSSPLLTGIPYCFWSKGQNCSKVRLLRSWRCARLSWLRRTSLHHRNDPNTAASQASHSPHFRDAARMALRITFDTDSCRYLDKPC